MNSPVRRTAGLTNRNTTPLSSPDRPAVERSPPTSPPRIRRRQTKSTWLRGSNKSVFVAAVVFFFLFFLGLNLLVLEETSNAQERSQRSMLTARQQTWLRQRPEESSFGIPTMHKMNHTSTSTTATAGSTASSTDTNSASATASTTATTAAAAAATTASWQNKHNVVHVIQTRLFQFQPDFLTLGQARLEIFKAFTVPSMGNQTTPDFLWIVRTDPALHTDLKSGLLAAVQHLDNVMVIASNYNPEGFRDYSAIANITNDSVWAGNWNLLQSYHDAAQSRIVVESRLDADDALNTEFCESVQQQVVEQLEDDKAWSVGCAEFHVEWQQYSPWNDTDRDKGALVGLASQKCVTPGLTFAYGGAASRADIPASAHHKIHSDLPACSKHQTTECLYRLHVPDKMPVAIRARTVTSAGMSSLFREDAFGQKGLPKKLQQSSWRKIQDELWQTLIPSCGLDAVDIWEVRSFLKEHETEIASDNLKGQCTKGHSCKEESRTALKKLLETS